MFRSYFTDFLAIERRRFSGLEGRPSLVSVGDISENSEIEYALNGSKGRVKITDLELKVSPYFGWAYWLIRLVPTATPLILFLTITNQDSFLVVSVSILSVLSGALGLLMLYVQFTSMDGRWMSNVKALFDPSPLPAMVAIRGALTEYREFDLLRSAVTAAFDFLTLWIWLINFSLVVAVGIHAIVPKLQVQLWEFFLNGKDILLLPLLIRVNLGEVFLLLVVEFALIWYRDFALAMVDTHAQRRNPSAQLCVMRNERDRR